MNVIRTALLSVSLAAIALVAAGCETTFQGGKLANNAKSVGIPFALVKPTYMLGVTPAASTDKSATYTLKVAYVPDTTTMYTLRLDPSLFADPDFTLNLQNGTPTGVNASATDQIGPTITTLGQLTANIVGALALGTLDVADARTRMKGLIDSVTSCATEAAGLKTQIDVYETDAIFLATFHPLTKAERACVKAVADYAAEADKGRSDANKANWQAEQDAYKKTAAPDDKFVSDLQTLVQNGDAVGVQQKFAGMSSADPKFPLQTGAVAVAKDNLNGMNNDMAKSFADLDPQSRIARRVAYLDILIADARISLALNPQDTTSAHAIETYQAQQAEVMGVPELWQRHLDLTTFLEHVRNKSAHGGTAPATAEYAAARAELDTVNTALAAARTNFTPKDKGGAAPASTPDDNTILTYEDQSFLAKPVDDKSPPFIVILCTRENGNTAKECN